MCMILFSTVVFIIMTWQSRSVCRHVDLIFRRSGRFEVIDEVLPRQIFVLSAVCIECEPTSYKWWVNISTDAVSRNATYRSSAPLEGDSTYLFTVAGIEVALPQNKFCCDVSKQLLIIFNWLIWYLSIYKDRLFLRYADHFMLMMLCLSRFSTQRH